MRICPVCLNQHCEPGAARCPDCDLAHAYARGGPRPTPRPAVSDPEIAAGLALLRAHDARMAAIDDA
jgi:hypothetical protein